eukprot:GHUV01043376.1.p1 GENE.GHUV01043376.1~~GHUV01043376.1.p1  ORF type:complete len:133 (+),score=34.17 GHUV01043376.1:466-864(+)
MQSLAGVTVYADVAEWVWAQSTCVWYWTLLSVDILLTRPCAVVQWPGCLDAVKPPNAGLRLFGGAAFERCLNEFQVAANMLAFPSGGWGAHVCTRALLTISKACICSKAKWMPQTAACLRGTIMVQLPLTIS